MNRAPEIVVGGSHTDERGTISFVNDFDMTLVKRFYCIKHYETSSIRGWRGHKIEQRWFRTLKGSFELTLVQIDDWETPTPYLNQSVFTLTEEENLLLHVPAGYASKLRALSPGSELMVFADYSIEHAVNDDYLYPSDYFNDSKELVHEN